MEDANTVTAVAYHLYQLDAALLLSMAEQKVRRQPARSARLTR